MLAGYKGMLLFWHTLFSSRIYHQNISNKVYQSRLCNPEENLLHQVYFDRVDIFLFSLFTFYRHQEIRYLEAHLAVFVV